MFFWDQVKDIIHCLIQICIFPEVVVYKWLYIFYSRIKLKRKVRPTPLFSGIPLDRSPHTISGKKSLASGEIQPATVDIRIWEPNICVVIYIAIIDSHCQEIREKVAVESSVTNRRTIHIRVNCVEGARIWVCRYIRSSALWGEYPRIDGSFEVSSCAIGSWRSLGRFFDGRCLGSLKR